jgi:hypothetical protein
VAQTDLSALLEKAPRNCWLALNDDQSKIVGRGETVSDAIEEAKKAGVNDPIVLWAPGEWIPTVFAAET